MDARLRRDGIDALITRGGFAFGPTVRYNLGSAVA